MILLITIILTGFLTATLTYFLWWTFGSPDDEGFVTGRIFSFYGKWLHKNYNRFEKKHPNGINYYKPLGLCPFCFGTWVALFAGLFLSFRFEFELWEQIIYIMFLPGVNLITLKYLKP